MPANKNEANTERKKEKKIQQVKIKSTYATRRGDSLVQYIRFDDMACAQITAKCLGTCAVGSRLKMRV
jgi:ribosomal protein L14